MDSDDDKNSDNPIIKQKTLAETISPLLDEERNKKNIIMSGNTLTNSTPKISNTNKKSSNGIISFITQYDSLVIFGGLLISILLYSNNYY